MNTDRFLADLPLPKGIVTQIDETLSENLPARTFSMEPTLSQRLARKIKYRGDFGLKIEVNAENYWTVVVEEERIDDDPDRPPYYRIVIETEEWKKVA